MKTWMGVWLAMLGVMACVQGQLPIRMEHTVTTNVGISTTGRYLITELPRREQGYLFQQSSNLVDWEPADFQLVDKSSRGPAYGWHYLRMPESTTRYFFRATIPTNDITFVQQPLPMTVVAGEAATFWAVVDGAGLKYRWLRNGKPQGTWIEWAANRNNVASLSSKFSENDNGALYALEVASKYNTLVSQEARLTVLPPPVIGLGSIAGKTITVAITSGSFPFASSGTFRFIAASQGNSYLIIGDAAVVPSTGSYTYTKVDALTGDIKAIDSIAGVLTARLSFFTVYAGTVRMDRAGGGFQEGNFVIE